jgi:D-glycero-D-manno-heptose 1,7-bisphosphate phosphatase
MSDINTSKKFVFIDRDGTINVDYNYVHKVENFEFIPGALDALKLLCDNEIDIFIVTNQAGIARGFYTEEDFQNITEYMLQEFNKKDINIKEVLFCPHHPEGEVDQYQKVCECRKPATGMMEKVLADAAYSLDLCLGMIGDKNSDVLAGKALKVPAYLVETGHGLKEKASTEADFIMPDLSSCVEHILKNKAK